MLRDPPEDVHRFREIREGNPPREDLVDHHYEFLGGRVGVDGASNHQGRSCVGMEAKTTAHGREREKLRGISRKDLCHWQPTSSFAALTHPY